MNLTQQRFLLNRLDEAKRGKPSKYGNNKISTLPKPLKVKQAEQRIEQAKKVLAGWEAQCNKARNKVTDAVESAFYLAKQAILFAETADAIKAVEKFERMKF
jgi:hypothetical protein